MSPHQIPVYPGSNPGSTFFPTPVIQAMAIIIGNEAYLQVEVNFTEVPIPSGATARLQ